MSDVLRKPHSHSDAECYGREPSLRLDKCEATRLKHIGGKWSSAITVSLFLRPALVACPTEVELGRPPCYYLFNFDFVFRY